VPPFALPGPSGWFPDFVAPTAALRLLRAPWSLGFSLRFQVPAFTATRRSPRFLGNPCIRAPFFDPAEELAGQRPRAFGPALNLRSVAFRVYSARRPSLGRDVSGLNGAARIPAVYTSQPPSPAVHARLASGWQSPTLAGQIFHLRVTLKVSHCYIVVLFLKAFPGARRGKRSAAPTKKSRIDANF